MSFCFKASWALSIYLLFISEDNTESNRQLGCTGSCHHVPVRYLSNMQGHSLSLEHVLSLPLLKSIKARIRSRVIRVCVYEQIHSWSKLVNVQPCVALSMFVELLFCTYAPAYSLDRCHTKPHECRLVIGWRWCNVVWQRSCMLWEHFRSNWPCWE